MAALLLVALGIAITGFGLLIFVQGLQYDDPGGLAMGYSTLAMVLGAGIVLIAIVHLVTGISVLRHSVWARALGTVIGVCGALLAATVLPTAFNPVYTGAGTGEVVDNGPDLRSILIGLSIVPYALVVVGLLLGGRHFRRRPHGPST